MKLQEPNDSTYTQLTDMLTPRHAPEAKMTFAPPKASSPILRRLMAYAGRCAAILVAVVFIGQLVYRSDATLAADKVVKLGLMNMRSCKTCRVEFVARMKPPKPNRLFHMSPTGRMTKAQMVYCSDPDSALINLKWTLDGREYGLRISPGGEVNYEGAAVDNIGESSVFSNFASMLQYDNRRYRDILGEEMEAKRSNGNIVVEGSIKNDNVGFIAVFADSTDRLTSLRLYDTSVRPSLLMLETTSITYSN